MCALHLHARPCRAECPREKRMNQSEERRRERSSYSDVALQRWFAAVADRHDLVGLVLADSAGLLVASNIPGAEAEELAAVAPLVNQPDALADRNPTPLAIGKIEVDETPLLLCAVGAGGGRADALRNAESGVKRILAQH